MALPLTGQAGQASDVGTKDLLAAWARLGTKINRNFWIDFARSHRLTIGRRVVHELSAQALSHECTASCTILPWQFALADLQHCPRHLTVDNGLAPLKALWEENIGVTLASDLIGGTEIEVQGQDLGLIYREVLRKRWLANSNHIRELEWYWYGQDHGLRSHSDQSAQDLISSFRTHKCNMDCDLTDRHFYVAKVVKDLKQAPTQKSNIRLPAPLDATAFQPSAWPTLPSEQTSAANWTKFIQSINKDAMKHWPCSACGRRVLGPPSFTFAPATIDTTILTETYSSCSHNAAAGTSVLDLRPDGKYWLCKTCPKAISKDGTRFERAPHLSYARGTRLGDIPPELADLSLIEGWAICRSRPTKCFVKVDKGGKNRLATKGNLAILPQNPSKLLLALPPPSDVLADDVVILFQGDNKEADHDRLQKSASLVRRSKIRAALIWLKANNPLYSDIILDETALQTYPEDGPLPGPLFADSPEMVKANQAVGSSYCPEAQEDGLPETAQTENDEEDEESGTPITFAVSGFMDPELRDDNFLARKSAALLRVRQGEKYLKYPQGNQLVSHYDNPEVWGHMFPILFPYGCGLPDKIPKVSLRAYTQYLLELEDRRFNRCPEFGFVMLNLIERSEVSFSTRLRCNEAMKERVSERLELLDTVTITPLVRKLKEDKNYKAQDSTEKAIFDLMEDCHTVTKNVFGSPAYFRRRREEVLAMIAQYGTPSLFVTINPNDEQNPIFQVLAGRNLDLDAHFSHLESQAKEYFLRRSAIDNDYGASVEGFDHLIHAWIEAFLAYGSPGGGLFGHTLAHYGMTEAQAKGRLHIHLFIWLKSSPSPVQLKEAIVQEPEYASRVADWADSVISCGFPEGSTSSGRYPKNLPRDQKLYLDKAETRQMPLMAMPISDYYDIQAQIQDLRDLLEMVQMHDHCSTCYTHQKYQPLEGRDDMNALCRFKAPWDLEDKTHFDEDQKLVLKRANAWMNQYNPTIAKALRCNHDVKLILSGTMAKAQVMYVTNYITKMSLDNYTCLNAYNAKIIRDKTRLGENYEPTEDPKKAMQQLCNTFLGARELSVHQALHYLKGFNPAYHSDQFALVFWWQFLEHAVASYATLLPELSSVEEILDHSGDVTMSNETPASNDVDVELPGDPDDPVERKGTAWEDYAYRPNSLANLSLWEFSGSCYKVKFGKEGHITRQFTEEHPEHASHGIACFRNTKIPVLLGPSIPKRDVKDPEAWGRSMCLLFIPWRDVLNLKADDTSWVQTWNDRVASNDCPERLKQVANHMQELSECYEAADDWSAQRRAQMELEARERRSGLYGGDDHDEYPEEGPEEPFTADEIRPDFLLNHSYRTDRKTRAVASLDARGLYIQREVSHSPSTSSMISPSCGVETDKADADEHTKRAYALYKSGSSQEQDEEDDGDETAPIPNQRSRPSHLPKMMQLAEVKRMIRDKGVNGVLSWKHNFREGARHLSKSYTLNEEQDVAYGCLAEHLFNGIYIQEQGGKQKQLRMMLGGPGGSGKSQVFAAIRDLFASLGMSHMLAVTAPTGIAAVNIQGITIHSLLSLVDKFDPQQGSPAQPADNPEPATGKRKNNRGHGKGKKAPKEMNDKKRARLIKRLKDIQYIIIDEISFIGPRTLETIDKNLQAAKQNNEMFGGVHMIFAGDSAQLPPVCEKGLHDLHAGDANFLHQSAGPRAKIAHLFHNMTHTIELVKVMRQKHPAWADLVSRGRWGNCTHADIEKINNRLIDRLDQREVATKSGAQAWMEGREMPLLTATNKVKQVHNVLMARSQAYLQNEVVEYAYSLDTKKTTAGVRQLTRSDKLLAWQECDKGRTDDLHGYIPMVRNMPVLLGDNTAVSIGIAKGAIGRLVSWTYWKRNGVRYASSATVHLPDYRGPAIGESPSPCILRLHFPALSPSPTRLPPPPSPPRGRRKFRR